MCKGLLTEILRTHVEGTLECPQKAGIFGKSCLLCRFQNRHTGADQLTCQQQSFLADVLVNAVAGDILETVHQVVAADIKAARQIVDGEWSIQMGCDIAADFLDFRVRSVAVAVFLNRRGTQKPKV